MDSKYSHDMTDATAVSLFDYGCNIVKLANLVPGATENLSFCYERTNGTTAEVIFFVMHDIDGGYYLNEIHVPNISDALHVYALACADILKEIAVDEREQDALEDLCRDYVGEGVIIQDNDPMPWESDPIPWENQEMMPGRLPIMDDSFAVYADNDSSDQEDEEIVEFYPVSNAL